VPMRLAAWLLVTHRAEICQSALCEIIWYSVALIADEVTSEAARVH
jgi:hypothetical protein